MLKTYLSTINLLEKYGNLYIYINENIKFKQSYLIKFVSTVCLSTVDRRSRERFIESNQQIEALVERFRQERIPGPSLGAAASKVTLAYGKPGQAKVIAVLYM